MTTIAPFPRLAAYPVLATVAFVLDSPPVSLNRTYAARVVRRQRASLSVPYRSEQDYRAHIYMNSEAEDRKRLIARAAQFARAHVRTWPTDEWIPLHVRLSMYAYNTAGDAGNEVKLAADALEHVLYANDRVVSIGEIPKPQSDYTKKPRVEYIVDLLEVRTPLEAREAEIAQLRRRETALAKKAERNRLDAEVAVELAEVRASIRVCQQAATRAVGAPP